MMNGLNIPQEALPSQDPSGPVPAPKAGHFDSVVFIVSLSGFKRKLTVPKSAFTKSLRAAVVSRFLDAYTQTSSPKSAPLSFTLDDRVVDIHKPVAAFVNATLMYLVIAPVEDPPQEAPAVFFVRCEGTELKLKVMERRLADPFEDVVVKPFLKVFNKRRAPTPGLPSVARAEVCGIAIDLAAPVAAIASLDGTAVHVLLLEKEEVREEETGDAGGVEGDSAPSPSSEDAAVATDSAVADEDAQPAPPLALAPAATDADARPPEAKEEPTECTRGHVGLQQVGRPERRRRR